MSLGNYVNSALTWEKKKTFDLGLDFRLWDRFYGTIDYYNTTVDDMIWDQPIAMTLGQASIARNSAKMRNQGIEIELGVDIHQDPGYPLVVLCKRHALHQQDHQRSRRHRNESA
ncbi:MAG: TonB-dependent receptor domain-containing protein [Alistipes indistinctus]